MKSERTDGMLTDCIYERDGYVSEFSARVLECHKYDKGYGLILDLTAFFPEGGGQQPDKGEIDGQEVTDVQIVDGQIIHYVANEVEVGKEVACSIDFRLRLYRMQQHGAEHLICGLIHKKYGYENSGFHMSDQEVVFDVSGPLTKEQIKEIEAEANEVVAMNVPIYASFPTEEEARNTDYRSKLDTYENIRLVTIEGFDVCACCAPQVSSTAQLGCIKIIDAFPHRGGTRMTLLAGISAYEDYEQIADINQGIRELVSAKRYETYDKTKELSDKCQKLLEENVRLKKEMTDIIFEKYKKILDEKKDEDFSPLLIFTESLDNVQLRNLINNCTERYDGLVAGFIGNDMDGYRYIIGASKNCHIDIEGVTGLKELAANLAKNLSGRGGGNDDMIQGSLQTSEKEIREFFKILP